MEYPHNAAPADHHVLDVIAERWSPYAFSSEAIEQEKIAALFEAARWAPSSFNEQPWRYLYAEKRDGTDRDKMESLLLEGNSWAKEAGLLILSFSKKTFAKNGRENVHALHDLGCATGFLTLQAVSFGLISHQMAGFNRLRANEILGVPGDFVPGSMIAVGYPRSASLLPPELREREERPRTRMGAEEFVTSLSGHRLGGG